MRRRLAQALIGRVFEQVIVGRRVRVSQLAVLDLEFAEGVGFELFDVGFAGAVSVWGRGRMLVFV